MSDLELSLSSCSRGSRLHGEICDTRSEATGFCQSCRSAVPERSNVGTNLKYVVLHSARDASGTYRIWLEGVTLLSSNMSCAEENYLPQDDGTLRIDRI